MIYITTVFLIISILLIGSLLSFFLLSANGYVENFKISKGNINFYKYNRNNFKKFIIKIQESNNALSFSQYLIKYLTLCSSIFIIFEIINENNILEKNGFIIIFLLFMFSRLSDNMFLEKIIEYPEAMKITFISLFLVLFNYCISYYLLIDLEDYKVLSIITKIIVFFNSIFVVYLFDYLIDLKKKNIIEMFFDKIIVFYLLISLFVHLNSFSPVEKTSIKIIYYSMSILLIEFMSSYIKKNIGKLKSIQILRFSTKHISIYYFLSLLTLMGLKHVL